MMWTVIREKEIKSQCFAELPNFCTGSSLRKYGVGCSDMGRGGCQRSVLAESQASAKQKSVFTFCTMTRPGCSDTTFPRVESLRTHIKNAHKTLSKQNVKTISRRQSFGIAWDFYVQIVQYWMAHFYI